MLDADHLPVEAAIVNLVGLARGSQTDSAGRFVLTAVPAGRVTLRVLSMRHAPLERELEVHAGETTPASVVVGAERVARVLDVVVVHGTKRIDDTRTESVHGFDRRELAENIGDHLADVIALVPGIVATSGQLHVRAGRGDELEQRIADVGVNDPRNAHGADIASVAVAKLEVHTGGLNAETGGALSGSVNVETREGADSLGGEVRWDTDRFGDPTKTFDRYDHVALGFGGPGPFRGLTYFLAYDGAYSDAYPRSGMTTPERTLFDFIQLGNRQSNEARTSAKLAYTASDRDKLTFDTILNRTIVTPYEHMWSREGWVQVRPDTVRATDGSATIVPRYGTWASQPADSTYVPMNLANRTPTDDDRFRQLTAAWTRQVSGVTVLTTRLSAVEFLARRSVGRLEPWEYDTQSPQYWSGNIGPGTEDNPFYVTHGDFPRYEKHRSSTVALKSDLTTGRWQRHVMKTGVETRYHRLENLGLVQPNQESDGLPGASRSEYVNYQPEGAAYVQDQWRFEGLVLNAGVRFDVFTPGDQVATSDLPSGQRFKHQISPRLGVAYPISVRDVLSFHYGWTYQTPQRGYIFENRGLNANVNIRGNPDLQPETNVAYQAALQHLFSTDLSGQFAVFFRDIFGLIGVRQEKDLYGNLVNEYVNGDYSSARGVEASLTKSFSHRFSADLGYTYSLATGVASDPNEALQFFNGGRRYLPIGEGALNWDQRHTLSLRSTIREPGRWGVRMLWTYGSGLPFTPEFREDRRPDPKLANSLRLPSTSTVSIDLDQYFRLWNRGMTAFVDARNVLDARNIANLSPNDAAVFNPNLNATADDYRAYFTETHRAGGAYLQDRDRDGVADWVPVRDPRVYEEGRRVRLGVAMAF